MNMTQSLAALFGWPFFILILGVYSLTRLITKDSIIDKWRDNFYVKFPHEGFQSKRKPQRGKNQIISGGVYYVTEGTKLGELVHCPWCMGFWVSIALFAAFVAWPIGTTFFLVPFGIRVIPGMIESIIE